MHNLERLMQLGMKRTFQVDDHIFNAGEPGQEMYIILSGRVNVYLTSVDGSPVQISTLEPGDFLGEMSLLDDQPRSATAVAVEDTIAISLNKRNFLTFISEQPEMALKIMKSLSNRVRLLNLELIKWGSSIRRLQYSQSTDPSTNQDTKSQAGSDSDIRQILQPDDSTPKETVVPEPESLVNSSQSGSIFPEGHKTYSLPVPASDSEYLFKKQVHCPVCKETFEAKNQRITKLKLEKIEHNFRKRYQSFEPLWYMIWVCPNCYYANFYLDFESLSTGKLETLREKLQFVKNNVFFEVTESRDINQVFTSYYLALYTAQNSGANAMKLGRIWMQLSWLYQDVQDEEMFTKASSMALDQYYHAMYNTRINMAPDQEQQCYLLLGELYLIKGAPKDAVRHFMAAIKKDGGKPGFNQQAQDRINDVRKSYITEFQEA